MLLTILFSECLVLWWLHHRPAENVQSSPAMQKFIKVADEFYAEQTETENETENGVLIVLSLILILSLDFEMYRTPIFLIPPLGARGPGYGCRHSYWM